MLTIAVHAQAGKSVCASVFAGFFLIILVLIDQNRIIKTPIRFLLLEPDFQNTNPVLVDRNQIFKSYSVFLSTGTGFLAMYCISSS